MTHCDTGDAPVYEKTSATVYPLVPNVVESLVMEKPPVGTIVVADHPPGEPTSGPGRA